MTEAKDIGYEIVAGVTDGAPLRVQFQVGEEKITMTQEQVDRYAADESKPVDRRELARDAGRVLYSTDPVNTPST